MGLQDDKQREEQELQGCSFLPLSLTKFYYTPFFQICLIGVICFCCPGMLNAVNGMGGGGQEDSTAANNGLTALYAAFSVFGLLGAGVYNILGPRKTLFFGCSFFILYVGSLLYYNHHSNQTFVIIAGGLLGMGAGLLWAGQGAMMTAYPTEGCKGMYISLFWSIFNLGGVAGGFIPFALNYHSFHGFVSDETYIAFMVVMGLGTLLTLALADPNGVIREDGSRVAAANNCSNVRTEIVEILKLFGNWQMLLLAPASLASNFFYTYQFNNVNKELFNVRTRAFNNVFYWGSQMVGSVIIGYVLDHSHCQRRCRGLIGCTVMVVVSTVIWGGGLVIQLRYSRTHPLPGSPLDFKKMAYAGPFVLFSCYGLLDAMYQTLCYWIISALTEDPQKLSHYSGFYKGLQSAGAAVAWHIDNLQIPLMAEFAMDWALMAVSFPLLYALLAMGICLSTPPSVTPMLNVTYDTNAVKDQDICHSVPLSIAPPFNVVPSNSAVTDQ